MPTLHLMKTYCLPALLYGVETWTLNNTGRHKVSVVWNNTFRHFFHSCWRESVKTLQYFWGLTEVNTDTTNRKLVYIGLTLTLTLNLTLTLTLA